MDQLKIPTSTNPVVINLSTSWVLVSSTGKIFYGYKIFDGCKISVYTENWLVS